jgi:hypothetical protein
MHCLRFHEKQSVITQESHDEKSDADLEGMRVRGVFQMRRTGLVSVRSRTWDLHSSGSCKRTVRETERLGSFAARLGAGGVYATEAREIKINGWVDR